MSTFPSEVTLIVRRRISAPVERLFAYWTEPAHLMRWWGPTGVTCDSATLELRVGGRYRIANRFADGRVVWISGVFEVVAPPHQLVYTWQLSSGDAPADDRAVERVSVSFTPAGDATDILIVHERIGDDDARAGHEQGWNACLDRLSAFACPG